MKKLLSILLCFVMIFGLFVTTVSAQGKNLCEEFSTVEWFEACFNIPETDNSSFFNEKIIYNFLCNRITHDEEYSKKYTFTGNFAQVPEAEFEEILTKNFNISSTTVSKIRALKIDKTNFELSGDGTPVYNDGLYTILFAGGRSFEKEYFLEGYIERDDKYDVYLNLRNKVTTKPEGVEGKDFFEENYMGDTLYYTPTSNWIKYTVTYSNSHIKYYSAVKLTGIPEDIIKPGDKVEEDTSSNITSSEETSSVDTSSVTSSGATSSEEENSTPSVIQVHTVAKVSGAELRAAKGVFPENTAFSISPVTEGIMYDTAKTALGATAQRFVAFNISAASNGMAVQPNGTVTAVFDIPEGYDIHKLAVIYVSENGNTEILSSTVDKKANTITAELPHFSTFVVAEMVNETNVDVKEGSKVGLIILIIILVILLLAGIAFLVWFFVFYRKKGTPKKKPQPPEENDDDMLIFP